MSDDNPAEWPVSLSGVTESVVTTLGPNDRWNVAALGLFAGEDDLVTARTWGNTRTRRNFHRHGEGYVQFVADPLIFVEAALSITERDDPVLEAACAWTRVALEQVDAGEDEGTDWEEWELCPLESTVRERRVPTIDRGFGAVIEATVAASRLEVSGYDEDALRERLADYESVVERAGSEREREALERVREYSSW
ncbi:DUF447 domain-containing protein [Natrialbaceae archaeon AArc-T1-2]|uniref:DUF447 domain-containing protein n=1 Tax=Natrialbaceae archaeon AArc-T1-2 TaxID=3053904 RepID=UPI00255ADF80|nr:DUF447 domain-containing protein [Natrialbaceae archaeon AArc-T1-2]WIV67662.1 DUF447 family protein [Natrialbaceae archaeon AArc-T1-2]